jgi:hypothetical protein
MIVDKVIPCAASNKNHAGAKEPVTKNKARRFAPLPARLSAFN